VRAHAAWAAARLHGLGQLAGLGPVAVWLWAKSEAPWNNDVSHFPLDFAMEFQIISEFD
jgi:uncharacterized Tic20 family protein